jgi:hypothetical protein
MKRIYFFFLIILGAICYLPSLTSCKKEKDIPESITLGSSDNFTLTDYNNLFFHDSKSMLMLYSENIVSQDHTAPNSWNRFLNGIGVSSFQDVSDHPVAKINGIEMAIPRLDLGEQSNNVYINPGDANETTLFGNKVSIDAFGVKGEMYVPEKVSILAPIPNNQKPYSTTAIQRNTPLTMKWNSDPKSRGVFIKIEYFEFANPGTVYTQMDYAADTGEFTIPDSWLQNIPNLEDFSISIRRGNYHKASKGRSISCIVGATMFFQLKP